MGDKDRPPEDPGIPAAIETENENAEPVVIEKATEALARPSNDPAKTPKTAVPVAMFEERHSGPLPHPRHLKAYEDISPGSAGNILAMARREQSHRLRMQTLEMLYPYLGLLAGSLGFLACVAGAVYLSVHDRERVALALLGLPVLGVIGWFVRSRVDLGGPGGPHDTNPDRARIGGTERPK